MVKTIPTLSKAKLKSADEQSEFAENIINSVREPLLALDQDLRVVKASKSFYDFFKVTPAETIGTLIYNLGNNQWDIPKLRELLETIIPEKTTFDNYEVEHDFSTIGKRIMLLHAHQIERAPGKKKIILLTIEDITERKFAEESFWETSRMTNDYLDNLFNHAQVPIIVLDSSSAIIRINNSFEKLSGYGCDELSDKKIDILFPKNKITSTLELIKKTQSSEKPEVIEINILTKEKDIRRVLWNSANIFDKEGKNIIATIAYEINKRKRAEVLLEESEERYRLLYEAITDGILITDTETRTIKYANPAICRMLGYTEEELRMMSLADIHPKQDCQRVIAEFERLACGEKTLIHDIPCLRKDGKIFYADFSAANIMFDDRPYLMGLFRDITERKHAEEEIFILAQSLKSINECVSITDMDDKLIFVNESFLKMYGFNENELIGKRMRVVRSPNNPRELVGEILPATISGGWKGELWNKRKDGSEFLIYLSTTIIKDKEGKPLGLIGVANDITERKRAEKELIEAKEKAELSNKLKDAFIANISHEIRTPLNGILGMASLIRDTFSTNISKEDEEMFEGIEFSSNRLIRTIDMILNYSRLQVGEFQINRKDMNLSMICRNLVKEYAVTAKFKSLELTFQNKLGDAVVFGDEYSITIAISNLINNAIKFTQKGFIKLSLYKASNDDIILEVKDSGIGISEGYLKTMFEPYQQEHMGYVRMYEGIGLGLSLVNKILNLNNAGISVESKKGEGTIFSINFGKEVQPVEKAAKTDIAVNVPAAREIMGNKAVLIVEDDLINQTTIKRFIGNRYSTLITDSSEGVLEILNKNKVDIILMDISIKGKRNGLELTKELKASKEFSHIPIIAVTAHAFDEDKQNALEAGCDSYLAKPFTKEALLEMIAVYVHK